jgi:hypothetical protein
MDRSWVLSCVWNAEEAMFYSSAAGQTLPSHNLRFRTRRDEYSGMSETDRAAITIESLEVQVACARNEYWRSDDDRERDELRRVLKEMEHELEALRTGDAPS